MFRTFRAAICGSGILQSSKTKFIYSVRGSSEVQNVIRARNKKKREPVEVIKWVLAVIPVTSFGLGCWQTYRLQWKMNLIDIMESKSKSEPIEMPTDFSELEKMEYKPVKVRGTFLHEKEMTIGPRALIESSIIRRFGSLVSDPKTNQGCLLITPFKLKDSGEVILVNRGWIPQGMKSKEKHAPSLVEDEVEIVGIVRLSEKRAPFMPKNNPAKGSWFSRDLEQMSEHIGCAPVWLDVRGIPDPPAGWPIPNQTRITLRNEHFSYLVTWFALSGFTSAMWYRYFIKKLPLL